MNDARQQALHDRKREHTGVELRVGGNWHADLVQHLAAPRRHLPGHGSQVVAPPLEPPVLEVGLPPVAAGGVESSLEQARSRHRKAKPSSGAQPRCIARFADGDGGLCVVHVERAARRNQLHKARAHGVGVANIKRNGDARGSGTAPEPTGMPSRITWSSWTAATGRKREYWK